MADILNNLNSANYITVKVTDDPITNGNNLLDAYRRAKTTTPNNSALSSSNRLGIILPPAIYDLGTQSLTLDTEFIDLIGSTNDRDKHYIKSNVGVISSGTVMQTADDVKLINLLIENSNTTYGRIYTNTDPAAYFPNTNLNNTYIENVKFLANSINAFSMRLNINYSGTFTNCSGGIFSFGGRNGTASGTFTDCSGGNYSFGGWNGTASGTFTNCSGGYGSFGGFGGTASGTFTDCSGGTDSFGGSANASGTFTNCTGGDYSFGGLGNVNGTFKDCTGGDYSFGGSGNASGTFTNCTGGDYSFGGSGNANGTFTNCSGGSDSFGGSGNANGTFTNCSGGSDSFGSGGTANGTFTNCTGGNGSFNL